MEALVSSETSWFFFFHKSVKKDFLNIYGSLVMSIINTEKSAHAFSKDVYVALVAHCWYDAGSL